MRPFLASLFVSGAVLLSSLAGAVAQPYAVAPYPPVPPPRVEQVPPPPNARFVWQPGHWQWRGREYAWVGGHYVQRRPHYAHYVPGHWTVRGGTWVWVPAHWQ
jgi:hypothetical protein